MIAPVGHRRCAITGLGLITPIGTGVPAFWSGVLEGRRGVRTITRFDASALKTRIAGEVPDFDPRDHLDARRLHRSDRFSQFSIAAARMALADAGLSIGAGPGRIPGDDAAVAIGSALGGVPSAEEDHAAFLESGPRSIPASLALRVFAGAGACNVAIEFGARGPAIGNSNSCASGAIAIGDAWRLIRSGEVDAAVCGGIEAPLASLSYGAFAIIRAMSTRNDDPERACRPFDQGRDGFVMGEGACVLVLEEERHARARGARIYAEVRGYGTTNDAWHMTAPRPDGAQAAVAMRRALETAGVGADEIDYVNAHASSTPLNDSTESQAIRAVLGEHAHRVPVSGTKPYYGHALGASGAIEAAISCLVLERGWIPPTLNLEKPGEGCELDHVPGDGRTHRPRAVLTNSFGFGGINASLVLAAPRDPQA